MDNDPDRQRPDWTDQIIDRDWSHEDLLQAARWAQRLESSPHAQQRLIQIQSLRNTLSSDDEAAEPIGGWDAYLQRVRTAVSDAEPCAKDSGHPRVGWRVRAIAWAALVVAALGLGFWFTSGPRMSQESRRPARPESAASMPSQSEVRQQVAAFGHIATVLDHQAAWLSLDAPEPDVGVADVPLNGDRLLLVRLLARVGPDLMSRRDLLIVPGQDAELTVPIGKHEVHYVLSTPRSTASQASVSIWAEVRQRNGGRTLGALATQSPCATPSVISLGRISTLEGHVELGFGAQMVDCRAEAAP